LKSGTTTLFVADLTKDSLFTYDIHKDTLSDGTPFPTNDLRLTVYNPKPAPLPPDVVNAVSPPNGTNGGPPADTLKWQAIPTFDSLPVFYRVQLATARNFTPASIVLEDSVADLWHTYSGLLDNVWYYWRVKAFAPFGVGIYKSTPDSFYVGVVSVKREGGSVPAAFALYQNYPNPFNPSTTIDYSISKDADVKLLIYNEAGQLVSTLINEKQTSGDHKFNFDGSNLASGVYFYQLFVDEQAQAKKMVLIK